MTRPTTLCAGMCVALYLLLGGSGSSALHSGQRELRIELVDVPRPISAAVRQIERHFGRVVTYEDVSYVAPSDIIDVTENVRRDGKMDRRVLGMRGGNISLTYGPTELSVDLQLDEVLAQLITEWNRVGHSGEFRVEKVSGGHHVLPIARKGPQENVEVYLSPLDARIIIPYEERDGLEMMAIVAKAISDSTGRQVNPGMMPMNILSRAKVVVGAQDQIARDVLWGALQAIDRTLSWQMLCDVGENSMCAISIHAVPKE